MNRSNHVSSLTPLPLSMAQCFIYQGLRLGLLATLLGFTLQAQAKTETFTLKSNVKYGEEGIFFNTDKGKVALNMYTLPEKVTNSLHKYNLNKGACIQVMSSNGFLKESNGGGSGIQSIKNCSKASKK